MSTATRPALLTLPNLLSLSRVALAAAFPFAREPMTQVALVAVAGISDFLDGWIARARHTASRWGALLDPITDRVFVLTALATFLILGSLTTTQYFVMLARDLATSIGFLVARTLPELRGTTFKARWSGKVVTTVQLLVLLAVPLAPRAVPALVTLVGALSAWAVVDYAFALWRVRSRA